MSRGMTEEPFESAAEKVDRAHQRAVEELRERVAKAKSEALKKVSA